MSIIVQSPFVVFFDRSGNPLEDGYIYIGLAGVNPETNPQTVYWDQSLTTTAAQPIRTLAGYPSRNGSPGTIIANQSSYSILVRDRDGTLVYSNLNASTNFQGIQFFDTYAIMTALGGGKLSDGAAYEVAGRATVGDGGGGTFRYDASSTATANGGTILAVDGGGAGRFVRLYEDRVDVLWFGTNNVAAQAAADVCFGPASAPNGSSNSSLNKELHFGNGVFTFTGEVYLRSVQGGKITGAGRFATKINQTAAAPAFRTNGMAYTRISDMIITGTVATTVLFDLDWDNTGGVALQSNTFENVYFKGSNVVINGVRIGETGFMGSENLFINCFWETFDYGINIRNFNALQNTLIGGNIQGCRLRGVLVFRGSCMLYSVGFQNDLGATGSDQVTLGGWDVEFQNSANDVSVIDGCRSESLRLCQASNNHNVQIRTCSIVPSRVGTWAANTAYTLNQIRTGTEAGGDGRPYKCTTAGTSGATEPTWPGTGTIADGTVVWTIFNYDVVVGVPHLENCILPYGQVLYANNSSQCVLIRNNFTRPDFMSGSPFQNNDNSPLLLRNQVNWSYQSGAAQGQTPERSGDYAPTQAVDLGAAGAVLFRKNSSLQVGFSRGRSDPFDEFQNSVAIYGALSARIASGANQAGRDIYVAGGPGTGTGAGGKVVLMVAPAGSAGSTVNTFADAAYVNVDKSFEPLNSIKFPTATTAQLNDITATVNTTGKFVGKIVQNSSTGRFVQAAGAAAGSTWNSLADGTTVVNTPI